MNLFVSTALLAAFAGTPQVAGAPQVVVSTLKGDQHAGKLQQLSSTTLTLTKDGNALKLPVSEILDVSLAGKEGPKPADANAVHVVLADGSRFPCTKFTSAGRTASIESGLLGAFAVPSSSISNIRFQPSDGEIDQPWNELCGRELKRDLLVVRKNNGVLDHLDGVIDGVDEKFVKFLLEGDAIPIKREKVFGLIYARPAEPTTKPLCEVSFVGSENVWLSRVSWDGSQFQAALLSGAEVRLPLEGLRRLDFSLGKVRYLSAIEPREVTLTPYFDDEAERSLFRYRRDRNYVGRPLRLGNKTYAHGLWIHSKTRLLYRIGAEYRRFQAVMGIDYEVAQKGLGDVHVVITAINGDVIRGERRILLEADVRGPDEPRVIDLDISGAVYLEILVDYGGNIHIGDHLDLADAKVIK